MSETEHEEVGQQVAIGFHQLGGIRLVANDVRLTQQEAFVLAGQLLAHATMLIQMSYAQQAAEAQQLDEVMRGVNSGIIKPPGVK